MLPLACQYIAIVAESCCLRQHERNRYFGASFARPSTTSWPSTSSLSRYRSPSTHHHRPWRKAQIPVHAQPFRFATDLEIIHKHLGRQPPRSSTSAIRHSLRRFDTRPDSLQGIPLLRCERFHDLLRSRHAVRWRRRRALRVVARRHAGSRDQ